MFGESFPPILLLSIWIFSFVVPVLCTGYSIFMSNLDGFRFYLMYSLFHISIVDLVWTPKRHNTLFYDTFCKFFYFQKSNTLLPDTKTMTAVFPHGAFCVGFNSIGALKAQNTIISLIAPLLMHVPCFGGLAKKIGVSSAEKNNMKSLMSKDFNISLLPGGFNEIFMMRKYEYNIYVPTGFIALAIKYEYRIYPILVLGENETFDVITPPKYLWTLLNKFVSKVPVPLLLPYRYHRVPVCSYYGESIACKHGDSVEIIQKHIIETLMDLFTKNIESYCKNRNDSGILPIVEPSMYSINFPLNSYK